jgi:hypothetical protein
VFDEISAVAVIFGMRDRQPGFMQPRRPAERQRLRLAQIPFFPDLIEQLLCAARDALGLCCIHPVARGQGRHGLGAHVLVLVPDATEQIVEQAFAQRAVRHRQVLDPERAKRRGQNRHASRKHRRALDGKTRQLEPVHMPGREQPIAQLVETARTDAFVLEPQTLEHCLRGANGAGTAVGGLPAAGAELRLDGLEFEPGRGLGLLPALARDAPAGKVRERLAHAADVQALHELRPRPLPQHDLGRAAADVNEQPLLVMPRQIVRHALIDEARLLRPGDHLDAPAEHAPGTLEKRRAVLRAPQGGGGDRTHVGRGNAAQPFAEARQTIKRAPRRRLVQPSLRINPGGKAHHLLQAIKNVRLAVIEARDQQVEAVGTEIHDRDHVGGARGTAGTGKRH